MNSYRNYPSSLLTAEQLLKGNRAKIYLRAYAEQAKTFLLCMTAQESSIPFLVIELLDLLFARSGWICNANQAALYYEDRYGSSIDWNLIDGNAFTVYLRYQIICRRYPYSSSNLSEESMLGLTQIPRDKENPYLGTRICQWLAVAPLALVRETIKSPSLNPSTVRYILISRSAYHEFFDYVKNIDPTPLKTLNSIIGRNLSRHMLGKKEYDHFRTFLAFFDTQKVNGETYIPCKLCIGNQKGLEIIYKLFLEYYGAEFSNQFCTKLLDRVFAYYLRFLSILDSKRMKEIMVWTKESAHFSSYVCHPAREKILSYKEPGMKQRCQKVIDMVQEIFGV